jgi:hypothetical protein
MDEAVANSAAVAAAAAAGFSLAPISHTTNTGHSMNPMSNTGFSPPYNYAQLHPPASGHTQNPQSPAAYDPMFGGLPTNAFSSPAPWQGDDGANTKPAVAPSPGGISHNGSTGTGPGEEKDPFLSLLEQLAESESFRAQGNELDFFLSGVPGSS